MRGDVVSLVFDPPVPAGYVAGHVYRHALERLPRHAHVLARDRQRLGRRPADQSADPYPLAIERELGNDAGAGSAWALHLEPPAQSLDPVCETTQSRAPAALAPPEPVVLDLTTTGPRSSQLDRGA